MKTEQGTEARVRGPVRGAVLVAMAAAFIAAAANVPAFAQTAGAAPHGAVVPIAVFARVGDTVISGEDYDAAFIQAARNKFYHGKPPEHEVAQLQRDVGQKLIDDVLLAAEVQRRNIRPDAAAISKQIDAYDQRYKDSAQWKANRERVLPGLKGKLERDNALEQLTAQVKNVPAPSEAELRKYYEDHKDKFTSPEQVHVRMILLKVDPSSPKAQWDGAKEEGAAISRRLREGAKFEELAHLHSGDDSAKRGGDMGFLHRGMLPEPAQKAIDAMKPGDISDAVMLLEGVAVFRLENRKEPVVNSFEHVRARAQDLLLRDRADAAWKDFLARLRRETPAQVDESRFLPLAAKAGETAPVR